VSRNFFKSNSDIRLPFEPKGDALKLKLLIREKLLQFIPSEYNVLNAKLISNSNDFFDVENVLFYNVGLGAFKNMCIDEIAFELIRTDIMTGYEYLYELTDKSSVILNNKIASFYAESIDINTSLKPDYYWSLIHNSNIELYDENFREQEFGLFIEIGVLEKKKNLVSLIKPMIDGLISSMHFQESIDNDVIVNLSGKLEYENEVLRNMFKKKDYSFLRERKLISKYRNGVKWNPEDELCTKVRVIQKKSNKSYIKVDLYQ